MQYLLRIEVMGIDTPNLLSRETTFLMGILKKCLSVEKAPIEPEDVPNNMQNSSLSVLGPTPSHSRQSVPSTEGVFWHSVPPSEGDLPCHSVLSMEERSQMNCTSIQDMTDSSESAPNIVSGLTKPSLSITDLPLTQEKVESTYADIFQGLGKFPGDPYKLRLKPDAVPAKHRPRKVPVHLQDAFHEEVE